VVGCSLSFSVRQLIYGMFYRVSVFNEKYVVRIKIKYPKLTLFIISVILVYLLFSGLAYKPLHDALAFMGYFGTFLAGLLYPFALTSAAGTGILLILAKEQNLLLAGVIADIILFLFVTHSFSDEVQKLSKEIFFQTINRWIPDSIRVYLLATFAGLLIASPLPTEIGILLMTSIKSISFKKFISLICILHSSAIFIILLIGNTI
jgi:hypothetical protein